MEISEDMEEHYGTLAEGISGRCVSAALFNITKHRRSYEQIIDTDS